MRDHEALRTAGYKGQCALGHGVAIQGCAAQVKRACGAKSSRASDSESMSGRVPIVTGAGTGGSAKEKPKLPLLLSTSLALRPGLRCASAASLARC